jgi:hypothetical protein
VSRPRIVDDRTGSRCQPSPDIPPVVTVKPGDVRSTFRSCRQNDLT